MWYTNLKFVPKKRFVKGLVVAAVEILPRVSGVGYGGVSCHDLNE